MTPTAIHAPTHPAPLVGGPAAPEPAHIAGSADAFAVVGRDLTKAYGLGAGAVHALAGVSIGLPAGRMTVITGPSGSGKSTLMHVLAGLDVASSGTVELAGQDLTRLGDKALTTLRRDRVGFVFQSFNLIPTLTAAENILLPLDLAGRSVDVDWFDEIVGRVGIADRLGHRPAELSGGQRQRVAIARALITRPTIVFADEPTGNLDSASSAEVMGLLRSCVDLYGQTLAVVTHDPRVVPLAHYAVHMVDGRIA
ncbi:MAG: hypothetical protein RLZ55_1539 [Actinomycetota bacterium]|jgi:putative ABC transport system ATP-binding protein